MALDAADLFFVQDIVTGAKQKTTGADIIATQTAAQLKAKYEGNADTNAYTDAEKTKLAGLDPNHYRGLYASVGALNTAVPAGVAGDYADVDTGAGNDVARYIWDVDDAGWVEQSGAVTAETAATIKAKYESNPDTNALTDVFKTKLDNLTVTAAVNLDTLVASVAANTAKVSYPAADSAKVGNIAVTQPVDLDQIETDTATNNAKVSYPPADAAKVGNLTVTGAVNLDTLVTDTAANTAKNSYPAADATKVGNLTVTAATDLDAIRTASHAAVTLAADSGLTLTGQELALDFAALPAA